MTKRIKIILILLILSVTLSFMSHTYSRYVVDTTSNIEVSFAKWQVLVNETDITDGTTTNLEITPVIEESSNVKANTIAPSSKGYFDIAINPTNIEMSFDYKLTLKLLNETMPDILISKYAILNDTYKGISVSASLTFKVLCSTIGFGSNIDGFSGLLFCIYE